MDREDGQATGNDVSLDDCAQDRLEIEIGGDTYQGSLSGKNLFNNIKMKFRIKRDK